MSNNSDSVISNNSYIKSTWIRSINAICTLSFWREFIAYFMLGSIGLWLPVFLEFSGENIVFEPMNVLTFGLVILFIILEARLFMDEKSPEITKLIVFIGVILLIIGYIKGVMTNGAPIYWWVSWVHVSLFLTVIIWLINHVNTSRYDPKSIDEMLGGKV